MRVKIMWRYVGSAFVVIYLLAMVWVLAKLDTSQGLSSINWYSFVLLLMLATAMSVLFAVVLKVSCGVLQCNLSLIEALGLTAASGLLNTLPARAGTGFKGLYLVYLRGLSISDFASITGVTAAVALMISGLSGMAGVTTMWLTEGTPRGGLGAAYGALLISVALALTVGPVLLRLRFPFGLERFIKPLSTATNSLTANPIFVGKIAVLDLLGLSFVALRLYLIATLLGEPISLPAAILLANAGAVSTLMSVVPGGLGIREAAISGTLVAIGGGLEAGIVIATLDRVVSLVRDLIIGGGWLITIRHTVGDLIRGEPLNAS